MLATEDLEERIYLQTLLILRNRVRPESVLRMQNLKIEQLIAYIRRYNRSGLPKQKPPKAVKPPKPPKAVKPVKPPLPVFTDKDATSIFLQMTYAQPKDRMKWRILWMHYIKMSVDEIAAEGENAKSFVGKIIYETKMPSLQRVRDRPES